MLFVRNIDPPTKLCLNRPLANNSTIFRDGSLCNHNITVNGNVKWSNGSQKFGQNSIYFDGVGDSLLVSDNEDFELGNNNFTIDVWVQFSTLPSGVGLIGKWDWGASLGASYGFFFWKDANNNYYLIFRWSTDGNVLPILQLGGIATIFTGIWYHCAAVRSSATLTRLYFNGVVIAAIATNFSIYQNSTTLTIGSTQINTSPTWILHGYLAQPRISKGIARWKSNFTPPKNPYM